jgi:nucleoside-diphosphate-sugar epimerase
MKSVYQDVGNVIFGTHRVLSDEIVKHCNTNFDSRGKSRLANLDGSNIAIIGARGFVGSWLVSVLAILRDSLKLNFSVNVIIRPDNVKHDFPKFVNVIYSDLSHSKECYKPFTHIFHLVRGEEISLPLESKSSHNVSIEVMGRILETMDSNTTLVLASSGAVYGQINCPRAGFIESDAIESIEPSSNVLTSYGRTKLYLEKQMMVESERVNGKAVRIFSCYGPLLPTNLNFAIGNFVRNVIDKQDIIVNSKGSSLRNYLHGVDLGLDLVDVLTSEFQGPINLGSRNNLEIQSLTRILASISKTNVQFLNRPELERDYIPDLSLLNENFPNRVELDFEDGLKHWLDFLTDPKNRKLPW